MKGVVSECQLSTHSFLKQNNHVFIMCGAKYDYKYCVYIHEGNKDFEVKKVTPPRRGEGGRGSITILVSGPIIFFKRLLGLHIFINKKSSKQSAGFLTAHVSIPVLGLGLHTFERDLTPFFTTSANSQIGKNISRLATGKAFCKGFEQFCSCAGKWIRPRSCVGWRLDEKVDEFVIWGASKGPRGGGGIRKTLGRVFTLAWIIVS